MSDNNPRPIPTFGARATSVVSVALVLVVVGMMVLCAIGAHGVGQRVRSQFGLIVELRDSLPDSVAGKLAAEWGRLPWVSTATYHSAQSILQEESRTMGVDIGALLDGQNPFNAEVDLRVRPQWANADSLQSLSGRFRRMGEVAQVRTLGNLASQVDTALRRTTVALAIVGGVLLIISFVLIANTVSLSIYSRRFIIHTMRLVGATPGFIRRPFMKGALVNALLATVGAWAVLGGTYAWACQSDPGLAQLVSPWGLAIAGASVLGAGIVICLVATTLATARYLRCDYDRLFK